MKHHLGVMSSMHNRQTMSKEKKTTKTTKQTVLKQSRRK